MTLLPCPDIDASPYEGPLAWHEEETVCAHPMCSNRWALETHHVVRRTALGGTYRYVTVRGVILLNERKVCRDHHLELTGDLGGHKAWIRYVEGEGWVWYQPLDRCKGAVLDSSALVLDKSGNQWVPVGSLKVV